MKTSAAILFTLTLTLAVQGAEPSAASKETARMQAEAKAFLNDYQADFAALEIASAKAAWKAACSGKAEDFDAHAEAALALKKFHSNPEAYAKICAAQEAGVLQGVDARALEIAGLTFKPNQVPLELLKQMVDLSTEIEQAFNTYRAEINGKQFTNNDLLEVLSKQSDSDRRREAWAALKQVGGVVAPKILALARLRNEAATKLGYENYWDMQIRLQEHDPEQLLKIFGELKQMTDRPFREMKATLDAELAERFGIKPEEMMPWHYNNPFFQAAPPSAKVDCDEFYDGKTKEEIVEIAVKFYADIGLPIDGIVARSDLFEREGKDQHAFCTSIDRADDVRTLCNITPSAYWMEVMLHEQGHAVYDLGIDRRLPFNLRSPSHAFTTEGVAMLFGALARQPDWMVAYAGADKDRIEELYDAILEQRRREQLIFARWTLVMLHFEKDLYEDPDRDLNTLWWDYVERFQLVTRPPLRDEPDWAAKPHFVCAPVYYHNYQLGELFGAQLRHVLAEMTGHQGPGSTLKFAGRREFGRFLTKKVFRPGDAMPWPKFVQYATGEPLTAKYFAEEIR